MLCRAPVAAQYVTGAHLRAARQLVFDTVDPFLR
jgi:hypothetical protein